MSIGMTEDLKKSNSEGLELPVLFFCRGDVLLM